MFIFNRSFSSLRKTKAYCQRLRFKSNHLLILFIILINSCTHISPPATPNTGSIYGKIQLLNRTKESSKEFKLRVEGTRLSAKVDTSGIFYIPEVPFGEYTLIASAPGFLHGIMEKVLVAEDSISIVSIWIKFPTHSAISEKETWKGIKIGKTNIKSKGKIKGHVKNSSPIINALVLIENTFWLAYTDSTGEYELTDILPGIYTLKAFGGGPRLEFEDAGPGPKEGMRLAKPKNFDWDKIMGGSYSPRTIENIRVAPDSTSIVDIRLQSTWILEDYPPVERKEIIIKDSE